MVINTVADNTQTYTTSTATDTWIMVQHPLANASIRMNLRNGKEHSLVLSGYGTPSELSSVINLQRLKFLINALEKELEKYYEDPANYTMKD